VVSRSGIGGFIHQREGDALDIKYWLLAYEKQSNEGVSFSCAKGSSYS
jgi:hypothetical protein